MRGAEQAATGSAPVQADLLVSGPGDPAEMEADRIAEEVTAGGVSGCSCGGSCAKCAGEGIQRKPEASSANRLSVSRTAISGLGSGRPAPNGLRTRMEGRLGQALSDLRVHVGPGADAMARGIQAKAFTAGNDVVFGDGNYTPGSAEGDRLLAHEMVHVAQQRAGASQVQRQADPPDATRPTCAPYEPGEVRRSRGAGILAPDVRLLGPGRLLISDFGVGQSSLTAAALGDPNLQYWLRTFQTNDSYRIRIIGYSDCTDDPSLEPSNTRMRHERARAVEGLLGTSPAATVNFRGMKALGQYITGNSTREQRATNRAVLIEFHQEFNFDDEPMEIEGHVRRCGPDVVDWLVGQMNRNQNHSVIRTARKHRWARWIPVFNVGWSGAALYKFAQLVKPGGPWDFKRNQKWWRADEGRACPTEDCDRTVTMCGMCFNYDVPGNIHYGWVGRRMELRRWLLKFAPGLVQEGGIGDDPRDTAAAEIGMDMADNGRALCGELRRRRDELNLTGTEDCPTCQVR